MAPSFKIDNIQQLQVACGHVDYSHSNMGPDDDIGAEAEPAVDWGRVVTSHESSAEDVGTDVVADDANPSCRCCWL